MHDCKIAVVYHQWFLATEKEVNSLKTKSVVKRLGLTLLAIALLFAFVPRVQARPLVFTMYMKFDPAGTVDPTTPIWKGDVSGAADGYMEFFAVGPHPAKDVGYNPNNPLGEWEVHFFEEEWVIYIDGDEIRGVDKGQTRASDWTFRMNGKVTSATPKYEYLIGHRVHMEGQITWDFNNIYESTAIGPIIIT